MSLLPALSEVATEQRTAGPALGGPTLRRLACLATALGNGWLWLLAVGLGVAARGLGLLPALAWAALIANLTVIVVKSRVRRIRPEVHDPNPLLAHLPLVDLGFDRFSFPSGHTVNAFALAVVLGWGLPSAAPWFVLVASAVALSRLVLRQHHVSDVLAGVALGLAAGLAALGLAAL